MRKKIYPFVLAFVLAATLAVKSQPPTSRVIPFRGAIAGQGDDKVDLRFRLFPSDTEGTFVFQETQTVTITGDAFSVLLGSNTDGGIPSSVFAANPSLWITFAFDSDPDTELVDGRIPITGVGYAFRAASADNAQTATRAASATNADNAQNATMARNVQSLNGAQGGTITGQVLLKGTGPTDSAGGLTFRNLAGTGTATIFKCGTETPCDGGGQGLWIQSGGSGLGRHDIVFSGISNQPPHPNVIVSGNLVIGTNPAGFGAAFRSYNDGRIWSMRDDAGVNRFRFARGSSDAVIWDVLKTPSSDAIAAQYFYTNGSVRLDIESNGNVGIGTTGPGYKLQVAGEVGSIGTNAGFRVNGAQGENVNGAPWYGLGQSSLALPGSPAGTPRAVQLAGFYGLNLQAASGQLVLNQFGNVGIGTTSPTARLHVTGSAASAGEFQNTNSRGDLLKGRNAQGQLVARLANDGTWTARNFRRGVPTKTGATVDEDEGLIYTNMIDSRENWSEDFGSGRLQNGVTVIAIDPLFSQIANTEAGYHVFITPNGDCNGLYVAKKTPTSFEVQELKGGMTSVSFDYRIVAKKQ